MINLDFFSRNDEQKSLMAETTSTPRMKCITDCSILNQTTCQLVPRRNMMEELEEEELWSKDGCYNSTLFQATQGYRVYEQVSILLLTISTFWWWIECCFLVCQDRNKIENTNSQQVFENIHFQFLSEYQNMFIWRWEGGWGVSGLQKLFYVN